MLYPILTESRGLIDLSGIWNFRLDDGRGFDEKWYERPLEHAMTMAVPASYNDLKEGEAFRDHYGWAFYQRTISIPFYMTGQRILLRMAAVTHAAKVYLNGKMICEHKGGFLPFEAEINDFLTEGENLLTIAVDNRIDHSTLPVGNENGGSLLGGFFPSMGGKKRNNPNFDFFNYCGITRPVKLYTTPENYIKDISLTSHVQNICAIKGADGRDAKVAPIAVFQRTADRIADSAGQKAADRTANLAKQENVYKMADSAEIGYEIETVGCGELTIEIRSRSGELVARDNCPSGSGSSQENAFNGAVAENTLENDHGGKNHGGSNSPASHILKGSLTIENPVLWQPLQPYLYQITVRFGEDVYHMDYGIRTVEVEGGKFLINGRPFYFKGYGKHEDTFPAGRGLNLPMNVKDISLMKWQGANSFRTSHYPYSEEMMRLCDQEGIVVIDETPAVGVHLNFGGGANFIEGKKVETFDPIEEGGIRTFEHHKEVIRDMIARDKNHACVVMWSIANEADTGGKGAYEYFKPLFDLARASDPQKRPCTMVSVQMANYKEDCTLRLSDVFCLNRYYGWYACGGDLQAAEQICREEMEFWNAQGKPFMFTEYGADTVSGLHDTTPVMWTEEYQTAYYEANHRVVDSMEHFIGEQVWNFADFATSQGLMRVQGNKKGIFTRDRRPKLAAHYFRERWSHIPDFGYKERR